MVWQVKRLNSKGVCRRSNEIYTSLALAKNEMESLGYQVFLDTLGTKYMCRGLKTKDMNARLAPPDFAIADDWAVISEQYLIGEPMRAPKKNLDKKMATT
jgi:hypothetical protein